jgi:rhamnulokinase
MIDGSSPRDTAALQRQALVAVDLGAESCRVSLLQFVDDAPVVRVVHRCANGPIEVEGSLFWDFDAIYENVLIGLRRCAKLAPEGIASIGVDGWAVDNIRLDQDGNALGKPYCYRDERTVEAVEKLHALISPERLYALTGAQDLRINTLYQLYADNLRGVAPNAPWLTLPEYLMYLLGGRQVCEYTNATHTQMLSVRNQDWSDEVFAAAGLSLSGAAEVIFPGTDIGKLTGPLAELPAFRETRLIAPACHDTASAIAGIPATGDDWAYISSGTWSLVGAVVAHSFTGDEALTENFTNQGGVGGAIYLQKNVNGMWMIRQCMEQWKLEGTDWQIDKLVEECRACETPSDLLVVDDPSLMLPGDMPGRINRQLQANGFSPLPEGPSHAARYASLIFHSLAARYAEVFDHVARITGKRLKRVFIVGGGSRNQYLNGLVESVTGLKVITASPESSTIGNFAIQLAALEDGSNEMGASAESVARWATVLNAPSVFAA